MVEPTLYATRCASFHTMSIALPACASFAVLLVSGRVVSFENADFNDEEDLLVGQSSTIGKIYILSEEEYLNSSSAYSNIKEMIYFILLGGLSIAVPMVTWLKAPQTTSVMKCL